MLCPQQQLFPITKGQHRVKVLPGRRQRRHEMQLVAQQVGAKSDVVLIAVALELGHTPGLRECACWTRRAVSTRQRIQQLAHAAQRAQAQDLIRQIAAQRIGQILLAELGQRRHREARVPAPDRAVVIGRVLVMEGVVHVVRMKVRILGTQRRDAIGEQQITHGVAQHRSLHRQRHKLIERHGQQHQLIRSHFQVAAAIGAQPVRHGLSVPKTPQECSLRARRVGAPKHSRFRLPRLVRELGCGLQCGVPKRLDLHRVAPARRPGFAPLDARVHPGIGILVGEQTLGVDRMAQRALDVGSSQLQRPRRELAVARVTHVFQRLAQHPGRAVHGVVDHLAAAHSIRDAPVVAGARVNADVGGLRRVRDDAQVLVLGEVLQHLLRVLEMPAHQQRPRQGDEGVAPPVLAEPWQTRPQTAAIFVHQKRQRRRLGPDQGVVVFLIRSPEPAARQTFMKGVKGLLHRRARSGHGSGLSHGLFPRLGERQMHGEFRANFLGLQQRHVALEGIALGLHQIERPVRAQRHHPAARGRDEQHVALPRGVFGIGLECPQRL